MVHSQALRSSVAPLPRDWNHTSGRHRQSCLQTAESDGTPLNCGLANTYHRAQNCQAWRVLMRMAMTIEQAT